MEKRLNRKINTHSQAFKNDIKYEKVVPSEHLKSPMHPQHPFYKELTNGYDVFSILDNK